MSTSLLIGVLIAVGSGLAIGLQSAFVTTLGQYGINAVRVGFYVHIAGAIVGGGMVLAFASQAVHATEGAMTLSSGQMWLYAFIAGALGMLIIPGVATAFPRVGIVVGQVAIILGQIGISIIVDTFGLTGAEPIPLDGRRILGLFVLALAIYLLLPQSEAS